MAFQTVPGKTAKELRQTFYINKFIMTDSGPLVNVIFITNTDDGPFFREISCTISQESRRFAKSHT